jgi:uncharacterized coiled-coil protein SlyX
MIAKWVAVLLLATPGGVAAAQQQSAPAQSPAKTSQNQAETDPLAAAARRAREQKKDEQRPAKVWDNDNLPKTPGTISVIGKPGGTAGSTQSPDQGAAPGEAPKEADKSASSLDDRKAEIQKELDQAKAHLKSVTTDLDIATRTYQLDQQSFYSNPNYASDAQGADKLKNEQTDIDAKKQEVDDLQKDVDNLTAKLRELESETTKPANPQ